MHKRIISTYLLTMGTALLLALVLSLAVIAHSYERGQAYLIQTLLLTFALILLVGLGIAYLLGKHISKTYADSIRSIIHKTREMTLSAAKYSAMIDPSTQWEGLDLEAIEALELNGSDADIEELDQSISTLAGYLQQVNAVLLRNNAQLQAVLQNMEEDVISFDNTGKIQLLTEKAILLLGEAHKQKQALGLLGQNYARLDQLIENQGDSELPFTFEMETNYPLERVLGFYVTTLQEARKLPRNRAGLLLVVRDLTRLRQLELLRKEFVANVTHELKTPLTSISGYIELLRSAERDPQTRAAFYEIIAIEAKHLMNLIQDLLLISELEQRPAFLLSRESCDLGEIVEAVFAKLKPLADEKQVTLVNDVPARFTVPGQATQQDQILSNLINNGIMYNNPGGFVRVSGSYERDRLVCRVVDNGIGIAKEDQERIFERFYRVHKERSRFLGGTGLGLSIVKHMVQMLGGSIGLDSEYGQGSAFTIYYTVATDD